MKYTKEYCIEKEVILYIGDNDELLKKVKKRFDIKNKIKCVEGKNHCLNLSNGCYSTLRYYEDHRYEIIKYEDIRGLFEPTTYEIY